MKCIEQILSRRSVRKFKNKPVGEEVLNNILEAGRLSPSATNMQPWHFVIARDQKAKEACSFGGFNRFTRDASFVVVGLYKQSEVIIEKLSLMDVTIALQNMVIAAWIQGVGSCWMGAFDERKLKDTLNLPADSRIVGAVAFGIPDENPSQPTKKPLTEMWTSMASAKMNMRIEKIEFHRKTIDEGSLKDCVRLHRDQLFFICVL